MKNYIKNLFFILMIVLSPCNVLADEIQLTDYNYEYAKRVWDGYSVVAYSPDFYKVEPEDYYIFDRVEDGYLKPNGTQLYNSGDYCTLYAKDEQVGIISFHQYLSGGLFDVYKPKYHYNDIRFHELFTINSEGKLVDSNTARKTIGYIPFDCLKMNYETEESESERVDKSYTFKEKEINGTKYYALFKELKNGETAADFVPTERSDEQFAENIDKMADDKLLFNNELCFFDKGITKLDFGIVLGRAYCRAVNYNIDNFTSGTHFVDVNHPYCLFLADKGILGSDNDLYINEKAIYQRTVLSALNKTAADNHILTEWSKVREIQDTEEECSRESAYSEIYKLYELLQNPDTPKDIGTMAGIYIIIGLLLILSVGALANNYKKLPNHKWRASALREVARESHCAYGAQLPVPCSSDDLL